MTSYLRSWLYGQTAEDHVPTIIESSPRTEDDDGDTVHGGDEVVDDTPPSFPALNSAQRAASGGPSPSGVPRILSDTQLMPPPPAPSLASRRAGVPNSSSSLAVPGGSSNLLALPPSTTKLPTRSSRARAKVALAPGHGPLDWANLKKSGADLRGVDTLLRITPSMLKQHNTREDAWSSFNGKVYNITAYLSYHPGGEKELMRAAGRDGTRLFALTHAWVNLDYMLDGCMVGFLVAES